MVLGPVYVCDPVNVSDPVRVLVLPEPVDVPLSPVVSYPGVLYVYVLSAPEDVPGVPPAVLDPPCPSDVRVRDSVSVAMLVLIDPEPVPDPESEVVMDPSPGAVYVCDVSEPPEPEVVGPG